MLPRSGLMATISPQDVLTLLRQDESFRDEVRRLVLTEELLRLPEQMAALATSLREHREQVREQMAALTQRLDALTQRVDALTQRVDALTQRVDALAGRVDALTQAVHGLERQMAALVDTVSSLRNETSDMKGTVQEIFYRNHGAAILGRHLRKATVVEIADLMDRLDEAKPLSEEELHAMSLLDVVFQGEARPSGRSMYLAMEISYKVDESDVGRAVRRAAIMRERNLEVLPAVAGKTISPEADALARIERVLVIADGKIGGTDLIQ